MRTIYDENLLRWEAWAVPARAGVPVPGRIVFRCLDDPGRRARIRLVPEGRERAEAMLQSVEGPALWELFQEAEPLD